MVGNTTQNVLGINEIHKVEKGDITFVDVEKYYNKCLNSDATFIIINKMVECPEGKALLLHPQPFDAYNLLTSHFYPYTAEFNGQSALGDETFIDQSANIHANVSIGNGVQIGANTTIMPNVVIYDNVTIGENVIIHGGSIIGGHAFYFAKKKSGWQKWKSVGRVVIENDVEIGSACTIDKGVSGITRIGAGTKLDNQVHVGHGVVIGKNCLFAAQCGIGGKTIIEDDVICWGQVGITKDVRIGKGAIIGAQAGVSKSLEGGKAYFGSPAREMRKAHKEMAALRNLPNYLKR